MKVKNHEKLFLFGGMGISLFLLSITFHFFEASIPRYFPESIDLWFHKLLIPFLVGIIVSSVFYLINVVWKREIEERPIRNLVKNDLLRINNSYEALLLYLFDKKAGLFAKKFSKEQIIETLKAYDEIVKIVNTKSPTEEIKRGATVEVKEVLQGKELFEFRDKENSAKKKLDNIIKTLGNKFKSLATCINDFEAHLTEMPVGAKYISIRQEIRDHIFFELIIKIGKGENSNTYGQFIEELNWIKIPNRQGATSYEDKAEILIEFHTFLKNLIKNL